MILNIYWYLIYLAIQFCVWFKNRTQCDFRSKGQGCLKEAEEKKGVSGAPYVLQTKSHFVCEQVGIFCVSWDARSPFHWNFLIIFIAIFQQDDLQFCGDPQNLFPDQTFCWTKPIFDFFSRINV